MKYVRKTLAVILLIFFALVMLLTCGVGMLGDVADGVSEGLEILLARWTRSVATWGKK